MKNINNTKKKLAYSSLLAMSSYIITTMFESGTPWVWKIW